MDDVSDGSALIATTARYFRAGRARLDATTLAGLGRVETVEAERVLRGLAERGLLLAEPGVAGVEFVSTPLMRSLIGS